MSRRCPTLHQLCPLSPWVGQPRPQIMVPPIGSWKVHAIGFGGAMVGFSVGGTKKRQRGALGSDLRWLPFGDTKQQST